MPRLSRFIRHLERPMIAARPLFLLAFAAGLCGCASPYATSIRLALDGPPLAVAMAGDVTRWSGLMDRSCMAGVGSMSVNDGHGLTCSGDMDRPATDKGRLYIDLACTNGENIAVIFRNLGPDQGMGLGRMNPQNGEGEKITLFFHPSSEEANRRLEEVRAEIAAAKDGQRKMIEERDANMTD